MLTTIRRGAAALLAAAILTACSSSSEPDTAATATATAVATTTVAPTTSAPAVPDAETIVAAFAAAGLPVPNPRDNSDGGSCTDIDCAQLITTDAVSVYVFDDEAAAMKWGDSLVAVKGGHRNGLVVLNYAGARTPEADRPRYEKVLASTR